MHKVIVVGGGAAGMMAALAAAEAGAEVTLLEKNEKLGKKLFLTGKGRCNVTNAGDRESFFANICSNSKFLYSAFSHFDNEAVMRFFEAAGCPLKTERGERVFPVSDHSSDIIAALRRELEKNGVKVCLNTRVEHIWMRVVSHGEQEAQTAEETDRIVGSTEEGAIEFAGERYFMAFAGVKLSDGRSIYGDRGILCTGGLSYPSTGSTGDGYRFAEQAGHRLIEPRAALVPLRTEEGWCRELMGLSLRNVSLRMINGKKELFQGFGEMLFTHFGVSGPLVLSASSYYGRRKNGDVKLLIDLKPALSMEQLDRRLLRDFEENKNRQFKNALGGLFPAKLIPVIVRLSGIPADKQVNEVTKEERRRLAELTKKLKMTVAGTADIAEAVITQGGVSVKDVNPSTMESKKVEGLYFAGEILDLDAMTGGFNLQIAWSTGRLAGESAVLNQER